MSEKTTRDQLAERDAEATIEAERGRRFETRRQAAEVERLAARVDELAGWLDEAIDAVVVSGEGSERVADLEAQQRGAVEELGLANAVLAVLLSAEPKPGERLGSPTGDAVDSLLQEVATDDRAARVRREIRERVECHEIGVAIEAIEAERRALLDQLAGLVVKGGHGWSLDEALPILRPIERLEMKLKYQKGRLYHLTEDKG